MAIDPGLSFRRRRAFRASLGLQHHPDSTPMHPQFSRDRQSTGPLSVKCPHLFMPGSPPFVPKLDLGRALGIKDARTGLLGGACRIVDSTESATSACVKATRCDRIAWARSKKTSSNLRRPKASRTSDGKKVNSRWRETSVIRCSGPNRCAKLSAATTPAKPPPNTRIFALLNS
jgi:hypothetical protein